MSFSELGLSRIIIENLTAMGYRQPRAIQAQVIRPILDGRDLIGLAQTGTGKTCAFIAPIAHQLLEHRPAVKGQRTDPKSRLRALVICPTRELAQQVERETAAIIRGSVLRSAVAFGKVGLNPQAGAIRGSDILIATPGRVLELLDAGLIALDHIRHVAIDEADRMLDIGFLPQVANILERTPRDRQTLLFTATMPEPIEQLAQRFLNHPVRIEVGQHTTTVDHVRQHLLSVMQKQKLPLLIKLIKDDKRRGVLVFCRTRRRVGWVGAALQRHDLKVGMIHGDRTQAQRQRALTQFADGTLDVLVATDVASRGLHIDKVRYVFNYDLPNQSEDYVHRIGRAGHGGGFGEAFTLLDPRDRTEWRDIERTCSVSLQARTIDGFDDQPTHARGAARGFARPANDGRMSKPTGGSKRRARARAADDGREPIAKRGRIRKRSGSKRPVNKGEKPGGGVKRQGK